MAVETNVIRDEELLDKLVAAREQILREIRKVIIGQDEVIEQVLISLFVGGHSIITGVPGLAKTLLVRTIANVLDLSFKRIQFTPDLMPADITGTEIIEEDRSTGHRALEFIRGPVFANIILADEISPDSMRLWDIRTNEKIDKDRFRRDLGGVTEAYSEVAKRLGILTELQNTERKGPVLVQ